MRTELLSGMPNVLTRYPRAVVPLLPFAERLPGIPGHGEHLPELELAVDGVVVSADHLARYVEVCGFPAGAATLPATYPHVLAFPLHMTLMTDGAFPYAPIGLVHVGNRIDQHRPIAVREALDLRVHAVPGPAHPRGRTFTLVTEARVGDELVWASESTMLRLGSGGGGPTAARPLVDGTAGAPATVWELPEDLGRRYAAASGDRNPIHLHQLTARLFGFSRAIAHGMWTKARCVAQLHEQVPDAFTVDVAFRAPILLPARVDFAAHATAATTEFAVRQPDGDRLHLHGELSPVVPTLERSSR